ncbi:hypothetical protein HYC85_019527 [Camellia sinensis]|uniref:Uncharacterized protein n=1 Tax=Camellia sinensis TaxID=4442 RepID=A0A7J7GNQ9_CAMSI|nr:hypothetical protein HYC85_019527 [Camellia sinensis]
METENYLHIARQQLFLCLYEMLLSKDLQMVREWVNQDDLNHCQVKLAIHIKSRACLF